jgi:agmatinase
VSSDLSGLQPFFPTFLGCPTGGPGDAAICIVGCASDELSVTGRGQAEGPAALRMASSVPTYGTDESGAPVGFWDYYADRRILAGVTLGDAGDLVPDPGDTPEQLGNLLTQIVRACLAAGSFPLVLGGDHSITQWCIEGIGRNISLLHIDAHSDLASLRAGRPATNGSVVRAAIERLGVEAVVTVGLRGFLPARQVPLTADHHFVSARDLRNIGPPAVVRLLPPDRACYVSLDVDVLDSVEAPGTNVPLPGGLRFEEIRELLQQVATSRRVIGADLVELNAQRDPHLRTAKTAVHLALGLLGAVFASGGSEADGDVSAAREKNFDP